jgi:TonB family protein
MTWNESDWFAAFMGLALKSTLVLGVAWLAAMLSRKRSAASRHLIWTAAAAALLVLPFLSITLPAVAVPGARSLPADIRVVFATTSTAQGTASAIHSRENSSTSLPSTPPQWRPDWRLWLAILWAAGMMRALVQVLVACCSMWRIRRAAHPSEDRQLTDALASEIGIRHSVDVLQTSDGTMPMAFGVLRPTIFLPQTSTAWSQERRRIVLLHELAHIRRGDVATHWMMRLALIPLWWNPLAFIAWREFLKESERATDDLVLQAGARASDYANHLLEVARTMQTVPALNGAAVAMARRSQLEGRLAAILDSHMNRQTASRASVFAVTLIAVALVAPLAALRGQDATPQTVPVDVEDTIRAAAAQKNHAMLEKPAELFERRQQFDVARKLLESAAAIREEVSGSQSVEYGVGLIKLGDLEQRRNRRADAAAFYSKAVLVLGDRPEASPALMFLGKGKFVERDFGAATNYFEHAQNIDAAQAGPARMWLALIRQREQIPEAAEELYKSALAVEDPASGDAATTMELYSQFLKYEGREDEAKTMLDRSLAVRRELGAKSKQPANTNAFRIEKGVTPPKLLSKVEPAYTDEARGAKLQGTVVLYVEISPDGIAHDMSVVKGLGLGLDESAIQAVRNWRFQPGTMEGAPVTVQANIEVNFRLM